MQAIVYKTVIIRHWNPHVPTRSSRAIQRVQCNKKSGNFFVDIKGLITQRMAGIHILGQPVYY